MKQLSFLLLTLLIGGGAFAQKAAIKFDQESHNFGTVAEEVGSVSCDFTFTNTGTAPLVITNVKTSCGCTASSWTKEPVAPGATGVIKATYSTNGRPGAFTKSITVTSNAESGDKVLYIRGTVTPKGQAPDFGYPVKIGSLRMTTGNILFGLKLGEKKSQMIDMMNNGSTELSVKFDKLPKYVSVTPAETSLAPGAKTSIMVTYDASKLKKDGNYKNQFFVILNDNVNNKPAVDNKITVSGTVTK
jgi:hypothetical protein